LYDSHTVTNNLVHLQSLSTPRLNCLIFN